MRTLLSATLLTFTTIIIAGPEEDANAPGGKITGTIIDTVHSEPVEFANVALFSVSDSSLVTGGITNVSGNFFFNRIPDGEYYLSVQFIGYDDKTIDNIVIHKGNRKVELGVIPLGVAAIELAGAEIVADRVTTEYKLDRKVINVSQDISNTGVSAAQVLEKSPSVRVDIEGNVELRGSSNFKVFIDGKPSVLDGNEALQQIPANTIENIEVITNPSVKYDPDGTAGIININLKKNKLKGFSGILDATAATGDKYAADLYMNYKGKNINVYGGIDWNDRRYSGTGEEYREAYNGDTTSLRESESERVRRRNGLNFKAGVDINSTEKSTISVGGEYGTGGFGWDSYSMVHDYTVPGDAGRYYTDNNAFSWERFYYSVNAGYIQEFRQKGHELKLFSFYSFRDGSQKQDKKETDTDQNWNPLPVDPYLTRSLEAGPSKGFRFEADYVKPVLENGKFEAGYHFRLDDDAEDYYLENFDQESDEWVTDDLYTKNTTFDRSIHAIYGIFAHELAGFQYQLGLRGEYTYREIKVLNTDENSLVDRFDYFPSVHVTRKFRDMNQFMGSYSRRIDRPRSWYLEPFVTYVDESTRRIGNPSLLPEYTDSYELGYLRTLRSGSITVEAYYRNTQNEITRVEYYDPESGFFINTFRNLNEEQSLGIESSFVYDITRWFNLNLSGTYYYYQLEDLTGETTSVRSSNNWDTRLITSFKFPSQTQLQLNLNYDSPSVTAQGREEESYYADITARQDFLDKTLSLTLKVSDIFDTRKRESYSYGPGFYSYEYRERESRVVSLTVSYRLNNFKENLKFESMDDGGM